MVNPADQGPIVDITSADLTDEELQVVKGQLESHYRVNVGSVVELSEVEIAHTVVQIIFQGGVAIGLNFLGNQLYDAWKHISLKPHGAKGTFFEFRIEERANGDKITHGSLQTDDKEIMKEAFTTLEALENDESPDEQPQTRTFEFDQTQGLWKRQV